MIRVREIETKYKLRNTELESKIIDSPDKVAILFRSLYADATEEHFLVIFLTNKNKVEGYSLVSKGTLNEAILHPREVFKAAVVLNSAAIILAHNHPSGDCTPSSEDITVTKRLKEGGDILGIKILDHVIVDCSSTAFKSLKEDQYL